jgi:hypothetical protein
VVVEDTAAVVVDNVPEAGVARIVELNVEVLKVLDVPPKVALGVVLELVLEVDIEEPVGNPEVVETVDVERVVEDDGVVVVVVTLVLGAVTQLPERLIVLVSKVIAPVRAYRPPPSTTTPVVTVIEARARTLPTNEVLVPNVADDPTCQ